MTILRCLAVLGAGVALEAGFGASSDAATRVDHWQGTIDGAADATVTARVERSDGRPKSIRLAVAGLPLACGSTEPRVIDLPSTRATFRSRRRFSGEWMSLDHDGNVNFTHYQGRVIKGQVMRGTLFHLEDPHDPPGTTAAPECNTDGVLTWTAGRVRETWSAALAATRISRSGSNSADLAVSVLLRATFRVNYA